MTKFIYIDDDPESYYKIQGFENEKLTIESQQHKIHGKNNCNLSRIKKMRLME